MSVAPPPQFVKAPIHKVVKIDGPEASIGNPIVKVQDYWIQETETAALKANQNFTIQLKVPLLSPFILNGSSGGIYRTAGRTIQSGKAYDILVIGHLQSAGHGILIQDDGRPTTQAVVQQLNGVWTKNFNKVSINPPSLGFKKAVRGDVLTERGFSNYEIIYTGISGNTISLLYREFTPNDLARPSFFQNLQYDLSKSKEIQFKNISILIKSADNRKIVYSVSGID